MEKEVTSATAEQSGVPNTSRGMGNALDFHFFFERVEVILKASSASQYYTAVDNTSQSNTTGFPPGSALCW